MIQSYLPGLEIRGPWDPMDVPATPGSGLPSLQSTMLPASRVVPAWGRRQDWHRFKSARWPRTPAWLLPSLGGINVARWPVPVMLLSAQALSPGWAVAHHLLKTEWRGNS